MLHYEMLKYAKDPETGNEQRKKRGKFIEMKNDVVNWIKEKERKKKKSKSNSFYAPNQNTR